jgi:hypothetical protein
MRGPLSAEARALKSAVALFFLAAFSRVRPQPVDTKGKTDAAPQDLEQTKI